ncbi:MAG: hypothetical protein ACI82I_002206 [Gammaproteobacteria bacterium]|jgi:hypothetical protein
MKGHKRKRGIQLNAFSLFTDINDQAVHNGTEYFRPPFEVAAALPPPTKLIGPKRAIAR